MMAHLRPENLQEFAIPSAIDEATGFGEAAGSRAMGTGRTVSVRDHSGGARDKSKEKGKDRAKDKGKGKDGKGGLYRRPSGKDGGGSAKKRKL